MAKEELVENELSEHGLRSMHIVRVGKQVSSARWIKKVPEHGKPFLSRLKYHEPDLDIYHLRLYWNAREATTFEMGTSKQQGLIWYVDHLSEIAEIARDAILHFENVYGRKASKVLVQEDMKTLLVEPEVDIQVDVRDWVPRSYLFVL